MDITTTPEWAALQAVPRPAHLRELFAADPERAARYTTVVGDLRVDWSKNLIDDAVPPSADDLRSMPYQFPMPAESLPDIVVPHAIPEDERVWVPQAENVWFRPLCLNRSAGYWMNLLRVRRSGILSRHRHSLPVHGFVLKGRWRYLEHDWVATEGSYVFEPPGETHTLVVPDDVAEMITFFQVNGVMYYVDPWGKGVGFEDVFIKIDMCRKHYAEVGLGADYVDQFIR